MNVLVDSPLKQLLSYRLGLALLKAAFSVWEDESTASARVQGQYLINNPQRLSKRTELEESQTDRLDREGLHLHLRKDLYYSYTIL